MSAPAYSPQLPPVILVHGFASSFEHNWVATGWVDALQGRGRQVIGLDLPGHGGNDRPGGPLAAVAELTEAASPYPAVDLVGFSAGARVCALAAAGERLRVRRLVLAGLGDSALSRGAAAGAPGPGASPGVDDAPAAAAISLAGAPDDTDVHGRLFRRIAASAGNDCQALAAFLAAPAGELTAEVLARIACPVLVIVGERDHLGPADEVVASLPDSQLVMLPRVDHFGTAGHVDAILAALRFLAA